MEWSLVIVASALLGVAAISRRLTGGPITPAMVFVALGLVMGPKVLDWLDLASTGSTIRALAEATLALVLFSDASRIDLRQLRPDVGLPLRLLGIGLPLTIGLGALLGAVVLDQLSVGEALILAIVLAPTDAALGQAVVTDKRVPARIREGLNVESGLNDGICVPLLFAAVAIADIHSEIAGGRGAGSLLLEEVGYGLLGGVAAGMIAAAILTYCGRRNLIAGAWRQVIPGAAAFLAYGIANALDGSGFIAAFVGGVVFRQMLGKDPSDVNVLTEEVGSVLNGITFVLFGAVLLGPILGELSWSLVVYALLSLTIVRMIPVVIAMWGTRARPWTLAFIGWFGPRGLASIVFAVILVEESHLPHQNAILLAIYLTVGISVFAHGATAAPLAERYADWFEKHPRPSGGATEAAPVGETRVRGAALEAGRGQTPP